MDESDEKEDIQSERLKYQLLIGLKTTVEGLLSTNPTNVWGMYGGLPRLCKHMDSILNHRLKMVVGDYGSTVDYWPFVKGLKWLNPVMTPFIEKIRKGHYPKGDSKGQVWVRESLREHKLSMQLKVLVSNEQHMYRHYFEDAFLFNADYFKAMCLCLQAVEDNRVSLLADIDPKLLNFSAARVVPTHIFWRTSLPKSSPNMPTSSKKIGSGVKSSDLSALAPHFVSPSRESLLSSSFENAVPYNLGSSTSPEDNQQLAREALRTVLKKSGSISDSLERPSLNHASEFDLYKSINEDPLSNLALLKDDSGGSNLEPSLQVIKVKKIHLTRSESESGVARKVKSQRAAEMVEKIIHEDNVFSLSKSTETLMAGGSSKKIRFEDPVRDIFSDSETVEAKGKLNGDKQKRVRPTHKRSRSDIIGGKNLALQKEILEDDEEAKPNANSNGNADHVDGKPDGMFSVPQQGQSILNYLSQQEFHTCANLEKENAHFSICEALIAAIEQMKWNHLISPSRGRAEEVVEEESDEEIKQLQQRIRLRKRQKMKEKARGFPVLIDGRTDSTTTSHSPSASPFSSQHDSEYSDSDSSSGNDDGQIELTMDESQSNLTTLKNSGLSLSMASMFSDADLQKGNRAILNYDSVQESGSLLSAESVAISLLKKFSHHELPKASDLHWLVTEQEAPQRLLPLPNSYPVSPDDADALTKGRGAVKVPRLRGNMEWAPPRAQIIYNSHPYSSRTTLLIKQNYRCAGCGMKVEPGYAKNYRYCKYLGKYFCHSCHSNQLSMIPACILHKWDFTKYYVSNFAYDLLAKIADEPVFNISDINPMLYKKKAYLTHIKDWRTQIRHLKSLLTLCKQATSLMEDINRLPRYWLEDVHLYTLNDLISMKSRTTSQVYIKQRQLATDGIDHVENCSRCQNFGFFCEMCGDRNDILFPYQLDKVSICQGCKTCFHKTCFVPLKCPKCARIQARQQRLKELSSDDLEEMEKTT